MHARRGIFDNLMIFAAGAVAALGHAPWHLPWLSVLAFAFVLYRLLRHPERSFLRGWLWGTGYFGVTCSWIVEPFLVDVATHGWMAPFALVAFSAGLALFWGAGVFVAAWVTKGEGKLIRALALVVFWTVFEWMRAYFFGGFAWGNPGYIWADTPLAQWAAMGGVYGLGAITVLSAALPFAFGLRKGGALLVVLLALLWTGGQVRLDRVPLDMTEVSVRIIQPNAQQHQKWDPRYIPVFYERMRRATAALPQVDLVIWPEQSLAVSMNRAAREVADISAAAGEAWVLLGAQRRDDQGRIYNSAFFIDDAGWIAGQYDKHHLVPFGEYIPLSELFSRLAGGGLAARGVGYSAGVSPETLGGTPAGKVQVLICYEAVFSRHIRRGAERADMLVHITNDAWFGKISGPYQHLVQAQFRAIEFGLPLARSANTGISALIDPLGRIGAAHQIALDTDGYFDARLPAPLPETFYARYGDGLLAVKLMAWMLFLIFRKLRSIDRRRLAN